MTSRRRPGRPDTHYVQASDGMHVAYQEFGDGDLNLLFLTNWLTNIDAMWDEPTAVRYFDHLASFARVIVLDKRGSGVSDPTPHAEILPIQDTLDDARVVLDDLDVESTAVLGDTEGGLMAIAFAATYPERVSHLVLVNSLARFGRTDDYPIGAPSSIGDAVHELYYEQHGTTGDMLVTTAPSMVDDARFRSWWTRYQRLSLSKGSVRGTFQWLYEVDVRPALSAVAAPTLVVHRRDALHHRLQFGEYLAEHIEGAKLVVVEGADTIPFHAGDFNETLQTVEEFLTGTSGVSETDRMLSTVLMTDIVNSTALASELGDERWLDLLADHDRIVRAQLDRFRGREIRMTGDGCQATFDGPMRAVQCALEIADEVQSIGLDVRVGVHTGEIEVRNGEIGGLAIHIAARIMDEADAHSVLVSSTVKDLVAGSSMAFDPYGTFALKGVPGEWELFEAKT